MEVKGKIIVALPEQTGTSKAGNTWKKREYVLETQDAYPKKVFFDFFGDRADQYKLNIGDEVTLSFDIESREYNGRWFTSIRGWKAEKSTPGTTQDTNPPVQAPGAYPPPPAPAYPEITASEPSDDLPF